MNNKTAGEITTSFVFSWLPLALLTAATWFDKTGLNGIVSVYYSFIVMVMLFVVMVLSFVEDEKLKIFKETYNEKKSWKFVFGMLTISYTVVTMFFHEWYILGTLMLATTVSIYYHIGRFKSWWGE